MSENQKAALRDALKTEFGLVGRSEYRETKYAAQKALYQSELHFCHWDRNTQRDDVGHRVGDDEHAYSEFTFWLEETLRMPIIEESRLTGATFNFKMVFPNPHDPKNSRVTFNQILLDQLGLELTPSKETIEVLIVEPVR